MDAWIITKWTVGIFVLGYGFFLAVDSAYKKREEIGDAIIAGIFTLLFYWMILSRDW